jgi:hypothetical protein
MTAPDDPLPDREPDPVPDPPVVAQADGAVRPGRAFAVYSALRLALLLVSFAVLLAIGLDGLLAIGGAVLLSALLSLVLLRSQRDAFTSASVARAEQRRAEKERRRARLDDES